MSSTMTIKQAEAMMRWVKALDNETTTRAACARTIVEVGERVDRTFPGPEGALARCEALADAWEREATTVHNAKLEVSKRRGLAGRAGLDTHGWRRPADWFGSMVAEARIVLERAALAAVATPDTHGRAARRAM